MNQNQKMNFAQFAAKHRQKFAQLTKAEKQARYQDYLASVVPAARAIVRKQVNPQMNRGNGRATQNGQGRKGMRAGEVAPWDSMRHKASEISKGYWDEAENYIAQILNPFAELNAKIPDVHAYPTASVSLSTHIAVETDANGRFCLLIRDGVRKHYIQNDIAAPAGGGGLVDVGDGEWSIAAPDTDNENWAPTVESESFIGAFSAYRPVALGCKLSYEQAPVSATGRIVGGLWPGTESLPYSYTGTDPWGNVVGVASTSRPASFGAVSQYQGVQVVPAIDGITVMWRPFSADGIAEFRSTKPLFYENWENPAQKKMTENPKKKKSVPVGTPDGFASFCWDLDPPAMLPIVYNSYYHPGNDPIIETMLSTNLPQQSPAIIIMGEGLEASKQVYTGTITLVLEAIPDNRGFNLTQPSYSKASTPQHVEALAQLQPVPVVHSGGSVESHHGFLNGLKTVVGGITGAVDKAASVMAPFAEAAVIAAAL